MRFLFYFFLFSISLSAQDTFIKVYDLESTGGSFYNSLAFEDTLVLYGTIKSNDGLQWGILWMQCDTFGNVIQQKEYFDEFGDNYSLNNGFEMIKTTDNGYAMVGTLFSSKQGFFMKLDVNGNLEFVKEYEDSSSNIAFQKKIVERADGYVIVGYAQMVSDYRIDAYVLKTDLIGNELWKTYFGEEDIDDRLTSIHDNGNGQLLLLGQRSTGASIENPGSTWPHPDDAWSKHLKITINEFSGDIISEEVGEQIDFLYTNDGNVRHQAIRDEEGNFIHTGLTFSYFSIPEDPLPFVFNQFQIIKRDPNLDIIWETPIGEPSYRNGYYDIIRTSDNGYIAAGEYYINSVDTLVNYYEGTLAKVNELGEFQWMRSDTFFYAIDFVDNRINHTLNSVIELSSGSIIATGRIENKDENPSRSYGWMIKLDKDGCLTPGCHPNLTGVNFSELLTAFEVFPNPTSDYVRVEGSGVFSAEVYDSMGRRVVERAEFLESGTLDFSTLAKGIYFVNIQTEGHLILSKKVSKL